jgi:hypothetical protein
MLKEIEQRPERDVRERMSSWEDQRRSFIEVT